MPAKTQEDLALVRIVCCGLCFTAYASLDIRPWTAVSSVFWMPVSLFHFLPGPPRNAAFLGLLQTLWKVSLFTSAVGLMTRASLVLATTLGFFVLGIPNCFGKIHHLDGFVVLLLCVLLFSRCADAFTIDRLLSRSRLPDLPGDYTRPIRTAQALFLLIFLAAGLSKLRHSGLAWIEPENMRSLLLANFFNHAPPTRWALALARSDAFCSCAAAATMVIEISALPAIFLSVLRAPVVIALFCLQAAIALLMGIYFIPHLAGYALFIPWRHLLLRNSRKTEHAPRGLAPYALLRNPRHG